MICNKKDWEILDHVQVVLFSFRNEMNEKQKTVVNEFINLCYETTKKEKETRARNTKYIAERRKTNPNYARPQREFRKKKGAI